MSTGSADYTETDASRLAEDVSEVLEELGRLYRDIHDAVAWYDASREFVARYRRMEDVYARWRRNPGDVPRGLDFERVTAEALSGIGGSIPPDMIGAGYLRDLFAAVPRYTRALSALLKADSRKEERNP